MPICTVVEFDLSDEFDRSDFDRVIKGVIAEAGIPDGLVVRIIGSDNFVGRVISIWSSGAHARAGARRLDSVQAAAFLPLPSRMTGFEAEYTVKQ